MTGTIKSLTSTKLTVTPHDGGPDVTFNVSKNASVTINNRTARFNDLGVDDEVSLSGDPVTKIVALR